LKVDIFDIGGEVIKDDERYLLRDNKTLKNLILSSTELKPFKETRGHSHAGQEEVYFFVGGTGKMIVDDQEFDVQSDDVVFIPDGAFHKVINTGEAPLYFVCVFDGKRNH
jgi:mannose-6-phosphate isomerase-like protein (cupin superfamily)